MLLFYLYFYKAIMITIIRKKTTMLNISSPKSAKNSVNYFELNILFFNQFFIIGIFRNLKNEAFLKVVKTTLMLAGIYRF